MRDLGGADGAEFSAAAGVDWVELCCDDGWVGGWRGGGVGGLLLPG